MDTLKDIQFREAKKEDSKVIWSIIEQSIERRRKDGSQQWQNGYPNPKTIADDIKNSCGYVLCVDHEIAVYVAIIFNDEPSYKDIKGKWLSDGEFAVIHRVAISEKFAGKGLAKRLFNYIEEFLKSKNIPSIKVDTNFDNLAMLSILEKKGYTFCGEVVQSGGVRKAYEKLLK